MCDTTHANVWRNSFICVTHLYCNTGGFQDSLLSFICPFVFFMIDSYVCLVHTVTLRFPSFLQRHTYERVMSTILNELWHPLINESCNTCERGSYSFSSSHKEPNASCRCTCTTHKPNRRCQRDHAKETHRTCK